MRRVQIVLLLGGVALFAFLLRDVGFEPILRGLGQLGWSFLAVFAIEILLNTFHAEGWRWCLAERRHAVPRPMAFLIRTAGFGVNAVTPTATIGGEVVKGMLLRRWVPAIDAFASVLVDKLAFAIAQATFLVGGLFAVFRVLPLSSEQRWFAAGGLGLWVSGVLAFFVLQRMGLGRLSLGALRGVFGGSAFLERLPGRAKEFDARVTTLLTGNPRHLLAAVGWHVLAHPSRALQYAVILGALGLDPTLGTCLVAAAGLVFVEATMFLIPAKLGVYEGGQLIVFQALGYDATTALTVSFAMRLSELSSAALGLGALVWLHADEDRAADSERKAA